MEVIEGAALRRYNKDPRVRHRTRRLYYGRLTLLGQDLSVAGHRAGMKHSERGDEQTTRSGLFMDQVRIIREMRERDRAAGRTGKFIRPRYMVWENVDGARSSPGKDRKGEDFAAVIEECIRTCEPNSDIHVRVPDGGWPTSGCFYADDGTWSLAWRVVDAQYFGTPQRRRRVALLVDHAGLTAPEIMFDPQLQRTTESGEPVDSDKCAGNEPGYEAQSVGESVCGDLQSGESQGQDGSVGTGHGAAVANSYTLKVRCGVEFDSAGKRAGKGPLVQKELSGTLGVSQDQTLIRIYDDGETEEKSIGFSFG